MYYSKNHSQSISVPKNYSGNTFRVIDESDRRYINEQSAINEEKVSEKFPTENEQACKKDEKESVLPSFLENIAIEDILLLGLIFVIHQENPNDNTLLLLLILLLVK